jgi:hypothetical protein
LFDDSLIGFKIEYCFSYDEEDGTPYLSWCDGEVVSIVNERTRMVMIKYGTKIKWPREMHWKVSTSYW